MLSPLPRLSLALGLLLVLDTSTPTFAAEQRFVFRGQWGSSVQGAIAAALANTSYGNAIEGRTACNFAPTGVVSGTGTRRTHQVRLLQSPCYYAYFGVNRIANNEQGYYRRVVTEYVCNEGQYFDNSKYRCVAVPEPTRCPANRTFIINDTHPAGTCLIDCPTGYRRVAENRCEQCAPGTTFTITEAHPQGRCLQACPPGQQHNARGQCLAPCPPNQRRNQQGQCTACPNGQTLTLTNQGQQCLASCPLGQQHNAQGQCESYLCPAGQHRQGNDCVAACPGTEQVRDREGSCLTCPDGTRPDYATGTCLILEETEDEEGQEDPDGQDDREDNKASTQDDTDATEASGQGSSSNPSISLTTNKPQTTNSLAGGNNHPAAATEATLQVIARKLDKLDKLDGLEGEGVPLPPQQDFTQGLAALDNYAEELAAIPETAKPDFNPFTGFIKEVPSCQQLSLSFAGLTFTFPGPDGCRRLHALKAILSFLFYGYTAFFLIDLITNRQGA